MNTRIDRRHRVLTSILALITILVWFFPVYWMLRTALTPSRSLFTSHPTLLPKGVSGGHFLTAVRSDHFGAYLANSLIVTVVAVIVAIIVAFMASAALTLYRFRGEGFIMAAVLAIQMIPGTALLIPQFIVFNRFGLLDTYTGLILAYLTSVLPVAIWNLRSFFLAMPGAVFEAARVDGASEWTILWKIVFPLAAPGIVSTSVMSFIHSWNDYLIAFTFMRTQERYTLPVWLATFSTPSGIDVGAQMAASLLFALPVVIFFLIIQTELGKGSVAGAAK